MITFFQDIDILAHSHYGGKGISLATMVQAGFDVPEGFVLTTEAFGKDRSLREEEVLAAFKKLGSQYVAVRSSGTKEDGVSDSFAGQFDTFLYVTKETIIDYILQCHQSVYSKRMEKYCLSKGIDQSDIKVAVVVQKMINSEVAGVCFTINPINNYQNEIMIEAGYGLGESVVSGMVTPDNYIINKDSGFIMKSVSEQRMKIVIEADAGGTREEEVQLSDQSKQKLLDKYIHDLVNIAKKIELYYGAPMDIERALEKGNVYILQARPITTLGKYKESYHFMRGQKQSAMIAEAMILNFAIDNNNLTLTKRIDNVIREHNNGFSHIYFSESSLRESYINGKRYKDINYVNNILERIQTIQNDFYGIVKTLQNTTYDLISKEEKIILLENYKRCVIHIQKLFRASDPSATSLIEQDLISFLQEKFQDQNSIIIFSKLTTPTILDKTQEEIKDWLDLMNDNSIDDDKLLQHALSYPGNFANTRSEYSIISYLRKRLNESDISILSSELQEIVEQKKSVKLYQDTITKDFPKHIIDYITILQQLATTRFELKHCRSGAETLCMKYLQSIAQEIGLSYETFMMSYNFTDILSYYESGIKLTQIEIKERLSYSIIHYKEGICNYSYGQKAQSYFKGLYDTSALGNDLKGMCANPGVVEGTARIVIVDDLMQFEKDCKDFQEGEILITTMTSPLMMELAKKARGIITNEGGTCSHAAIIARELHIPCIVGTKIATRKIKTGDRIRLDAMRGAIDFID